MFTLSSIVVFLVFWIFPLAHCYVFRFLVSILVSFSFFFCVLWLVADFSDLLFTFVVCSLRSSQFFAVLHVLASGLGGPFSFGSPTPSHHVDSSIPKAPSVPETTSGDAVPFWSIIGNVESKQVIFKEEVDFILYPN